MTTNNIQTVELIRGQWLSSQHRIESAIQWLEKQDFHDIERFHMSTHENFVDKIKIDIHLTFETHDKALYWTAHNLRDARKADDVFSSIMSFYSAEFPDFVVIAHFPIEQNPSKGV